MNQSNPVKRTSISLGLAFLLAIVAISIQNHNSSGEEQNAEAKVYPPKIEMFQK